MALREWHDANGTTRMRIARALGDSTQARRRPRVQANVQATE
jgi:hypothetical protein